VKLSYVDTSAAMKLVVDEPESATLAGALGSDRRLVSSWWLHTELHCAAGRHPRDVRLADVQAVFSTLNLVDLTRGDMLAAGTHAPLGSNDAIHLAVAIRFGIDEMVTYDGELADAAEAAGLAILAPGRWCACRDVEYVHPTGRGSRSIARRARRARTSRQPRLVVSVGRIHDVLASVLGERQGDVDVHVEGDADGGVAGLGDHLGMDAGASSPAFAGRGTPCGDSSRSWAVPRCRRRRPR
jgi:uncharacterized protein